MSNRLLLYVVSALLVGLALFTVAGVKVYVAWSDEPDAKATGTTTVSLEACLMARESVEVARCQEAIRRKPQQANESCLYYKGKLKWCLTAPEGEEWSIVQYPGREHRGRYYLEDHYINEIRGYLVPTSYGWRAILPDPEEWRGGRVVRTRQRDVLHVYTTGAFGKRYTARGALAVEVAAHKLTHGDCKIPWTDMPCRHGVGQ
jgi:hypothetical protein